MYFISFCCRYNLDPEGEKTDDEVWKALEIAQLKPIITALPSQLGNPYPPPKIAYCKTGNIHLQEKLVKY